MIKVKLIKKNNLIDSIYLIGHANYDKYGSDIVCASVSSIVTTTVNGILTFNEDYIEYNEDKDNFKITIKEHNLIVDNLINNMINLLYELNEDYPKNIEIKEENL